MRSARTRLTREQILSFGPFYGAEGDGGGSTGGTGGASAGGGGSNTGGSNNQSGQGGDGGTEPPKDELEELTPEQLRNKIRNSTEAGDRLANKLRAAERERDELKTAKEEQERKELSDLENASKDVQKLTDSNALLSETVKRLTVENAFLRVDGVDWHDRADALRLIDLSEVEFDDKTGEVKDPAKITAAAKKLAKDKPHLVRSPTAAPPGTPLPTPGTTGIPPAVQGQQGGKKAAELIQKYNIPR